MPLNKRRAESFMQELSDYGVFFKADPGSTAWVCYDSLSELISLRKADTIRILDRSLPAVCRIKADLNCRLFTAVCLTHYG